LADFSAGLGILNIRGKEGKVFLSYWKQRKEKSLATAAGLFPFPRPEFPAASRF